MHTGQHWSCHTVGALAGTGAEDRGKGGGAMNRRGNTTPPRTPPPPPCNGHVVGCSAAWFCHRVPRLALPREIWNLYQQSSSSEQESSRRDESTGSSTSYSAEAQGAAPGSCGAGRGCTVATALQGESVGAGLWAMSVPA